ncbi:hypothetical protein EJB05_57861, partial [Eragrostis curvula]
MFQGCIPICACQLVIYSFCPPNLLTCILFLFQMKMIVDPLIKKNSGKIEQ